jgi:prefoldin subunit 5
MESDEDLPVRATKGKRPATRASTRIESRASAGVIDWLRQKAEGLKNFIRVKEEEEEEEDDASGYEDLEVEEEYKTKGYKELEKILKTTKPGLRKYYLTIWAVFESTQGVKSPFPDDYEGEIDDIDDPLLFLQQDAHPAFRGFLDEWEGLSQEEKMDKLADVLDLPPEPHPLVKPATADSIVPVTEVRRDERGVVDQTSGFKAPSVVIVNAPPAPVVPIVERAVIGAPEVVPAFPSPTGRRPSFAPVPKRGARGGSKRYNNNRAPSRQVALIPAPTAPPVGADLGDAVRDLNQQIVELNAERESLKSHIATLERNIRTLEREKASLQSLWESSSSAAPANLTALGNDLDEAYREIEKLQLELEDVEKANAALESRRTILEERVEERNAQIVALQNKLDDDAEKLREAEKKRLEHAAKEKEWGDEITAYEDRVSQLMELIKQLQQQNAALAAQLSGVDATVATKGLGDKALKVDPLDVAVDMYKMITKATGKGSGCTTWLSNMVRSITVKHGDGEAGFRKFFATKHEGGTGYQCLTQNGENSLLKKLQRELKDYAWTVGNVSLLDLRNKMIAYLLHASFEKPDKPISIEALKEYLGFEATEADKDHSIANGVNSKFSRFDIYNPSFDTWLSFVIVLMEQSQRHASAHLPERRAIVADDDIEAFNEHAGKIIEAARKGAKDIALEAAHKVEDLVKDSFTVQMNSEAVLPVLKRIIADLKLVPAQPFVPQVRDILLKAESTLELL